MIFQHTWEKVLSGEKTQTRRLIKPDEAWATDKNDYPLHTIVLSGIRRKYIVGRVYGVQPGRGKKVIAHICIHNIRKEDVRNISDSDVKAEGFWGRIEFLDTWIAMHDKRFLDDFKRLTLVAHARGIEALNSRPSNRYMAWVLTFKLVQP